MKYDLKTSHPIQHAAAQMITGLYERRRTEAVRQKLILVEEKLHKMLEEFEPVNIDNFEANL